LAETPLLGFPNRTRRFRVSLISLNRHSLKRLEVGVFDRSRVAALSRFGLMIRAETMRGSLGRKLRFEPEPVEDRNRSQDGEQPVAILPFAQGASNVDHVAMR
jgi:hypothetical protein